MSNIKEAIKIAFIDHACHKKTKSFDFLRHVLKQEFFVKNFWNSKYIKVSSKLVTSVNQYNPDIIIFAQICPIFPIIRKLRCKRIIWIPMYDNETKSKWMMISQFFFFNYFLKFRVLCFSKKDFDLYSFFFKSLLVKYYPKPKKLKKNYLKKHLFFWQRSNLITANFVLNQLVDSDDIDLFILKESNLSLASLNSVGINSKKLKLIDSWLSRKKYDSILNMGNISIAPRTREGIGHSFLELMARGYCVLAYNDSTHNEYISNGYNGFLFDFNSKQIDLTNFKEIGKKAQESMSFGYLNWCNDKKKILKLVKDINE